jgi:hypothetical protein
LEALGIFGVFVWQPHLAHTSAANSGFSKYYVSTIFTSSLEIIPRWMWHRTDHTDADFAAGDFEKLNTYSDIFARVGNIFLLSGREIAV